LYERLPRFRQEADGLLFRLSHYAVIGIDDQELSWREFGRLLILLR